MSQLTKSELQLENQTNFPNNNTGYITPSLLRGFNSDMIDNTVNQAIYTDNSASFNNRLNALSGSGIQGTQGIQGVQGRAASQGTQGIQGYLGPIGPDGPKGSQGVQGISGTGGQGAQGTQGAQGAGTQGAQGAFGLQGYTGAQGATGVGTQGAVGSQGANGANGTQGSQGTTGAGTQGSTGVQGAIGSQGTQGTIGAGTQGATGTQGVQGIAGSGGVGFATTGSNTFQGQQTIQSNNLTFGTTGSVSTNGISFPNSAIWQNNFLNFQAKGNIGVDFSTDGAATNNGVNINFRNNNNNGDVQFTTSNGNINLTAISGTVALSGSTATRIQGVNFITFSSSLNSRINAITGSGGGATLGSNTFVGNQIISGTFLQSGSNTLGESGQLAGTLIKNRVVIGGTDGSNGPTPRLWISGSDGATVQIGRSFISIDTTPAVGLGAGYTQYSDDTAAATFYQGVYNPNDGSNDVELGINTNATGTSFSDWDQTIGDYSNWLTLGPNDGVTIPTPTFTRGLVVTGSIVSTAGFAQEQLITDQSISAGSDTVVTFNHSDFDPSGWYNGEFFYFQPTIAGTYQVSYGVNFESVASGTGQINTQIRLNGTSVNINQSNLNVGYNQTLNGTYLVQMNGTTDTLDLTAYSSAATTILASNGTFFNIKLL